MLTFIRSALDVIAQFFGFQRHRSELRNAQEMKDNEAAKAAEKARVDATNAVAKAVETGNLDEVRKKSSGGILKVLILAFGLSLALGCSSTVKPDAVASRVTDFDGTAQDAGILGMTAPDAGRFIVTQHVVHRYRTLMARFGSGFVPPVTDIGLVATGAVSPGRGETYYMDSASMVTYLQMVEKARAGR